MPSLSQFESPLLMEQWGWYDSCIVCSISDNNIEQEPPDVLVVLSPLHPNGIVLPKSIVAIHPSHELVQRDGFGAAESTACTIPCLPLYSCWLSRIRVGGDHNWAIVLPQRNSQLLLLSVVSLCTMASGL